MGSFVGESFRDAEMIENPESSDTEQVVLISGATDGVGLVTALAFAARDFRLVLVDEEADRIRKVAKRCQEKSPKGYKGKSEIEPKPLEVVADLSAGEKISQTVIDSVITQLGRLDVLINNISFRIPTKFDEEGCIESYHKTMARNVHSVVYMSLAAFEWLKRSKGSIVNVSSALDDRPSKHMFGYCMSKVGITMLTKCLASDFAPHVRVNCVSSGSIASSILDDIGITLSDDNEAASKQRGRSSSQPNEHSSKPEEIAKMIIYLASKDKATCITGSRVLLDASLSPANNE